MDNVTKNCCACGIAKPFEAFNRKSASRDGRQPRCRDCHRLYRKRWYAENREEILARGREAYRRDPEKAKDYQRRLRASDPEAYRARYAQYMREWRAKNPDSYERAAERAREYRTRPDVKIQRAAYERQRKARKQADSKVTFDQIQARIEYYGGKCWICGIEADSLDHVKPLSKGGLHLAANLRPACIACNVRKQAQWWGVHRLGDLASSVLAYAEKP